MEVSHGKLLVVDRIANKYLSEKNAKVAYLFARNRTIVSGPLDDMKEVLKETSAIEEFNQARALLAKEFAERDEEGIAKQEVDPRTGQQRYVIKRIGPFSEAVERMLVEKYPQAKIDKEEIEKKTRDLLEEKVNVDFYRMELKKLPGFRNDDDDKNNVIDSGDLGVLLELGIIYEKNEDNVTELKKKE